MNNKILITGANGQLGTELKNRLPNALAVDVDILDITDKDAVLWFVKENKVDTIINCAAYTAVDKAEDNVELATKINVDGVKNLGLSGAEVIHISTDYVFDGTAHQPLTPDDETNPVSVYGKTKRQGEIELLNTAQTAIIIRTAWLYSAYGNNFVKTMRKLGEQKENLNVVFDQIGTPTYAGDLADAIVTILPQIKDGQKDIYHFTDEGVCSWYDFATEIMEQSGLKCRVNPIPSSAYPTRAIRPFYSVLDKTKIKETFGIKIPHWKESLKKCLNQF